VTTSQLSDDIIYPLV